MRGLAPLGVHFLRRENRAARNPGGGRSTNEAHPIAGRFLATAPAPTPGRAFSIQSCPALAPSPASCRRLGRSKPRTFGLLACGGIWGLRRALMRWAADCSTRPISLEPRWSGLPSPPRCFCLCSAQLPAYHRSRRPGYSELGHGFKVPV